MDNIQGVTESSPAPEAGQGQVTNEQMPDTSSGETPQSDVAGVEPNETPSEGQSQSGEEELILGKFKSQEDLAKAYKELESHSKKVEMDKAEIDKFIKEAYPESLPKVQEEATAEAGQSPDDEIRKTLSPLLKQEFNSMLSPLVAKLEVQEMVRNYGDRFKAVATDVAALKNHNPSLSLEDAFKIVEYDNLKRTSFNEGVQKASKTAEQKVKAQVETSRPSGVKATSIEEAFDGAKSAGEMAEIFEAMGPEFQKFAEISRERQPRQK